MTAGRIRGRPPKPKSPLRTGSTPPKCLSEDSSSSSSANPLSSSPEKPGRFTLFAVLYFDSSDDGNEVFLRFSDDIFTFPTCWLYSCRKDESVPSLEGIFCKNPSKILVHSVKLSGTGIRTTVNITWNTGTTSQFPALWLRVFGPIEALGQTPYYPRLPTPRGKNPQSGVMQWTLPEKRVCDGYRESLMEGMEEYMDNKWLVGMPTPLLREMAEYVELEIQSEGAETPSNDATAVSSEGDSFVDEGTDP